MHNEYVIIGGGAAGLAAAIRLCELNVKPLVIEAGKYPSHKVCGEFFSPESVSLLKQWNISFLEIEKVHIHSSSATFDFTFPESAGSLSHLSFDPQLADRVRRLGGTLMTETKVEKLVPQGAGYELTLNSGLVIYASNLIIATGRIPNLVQAKPDFPYMGIKAHFTGLKARHALEMFVCEGAYVGISPIEEGKFNVAALALVDSMKGTPKDFMANMIQKDPVMAEIFASGKPCFEWMTASVPAFGFKKTPAWPYVYFIGDAAGTIPPITGNGLSMSIAGGVLAAEFALKKDWKGFKIAWKRLFKSSVFWGKLVHRAALNPLISRHLVKACHICPSIASYLFKATRRKENQ